MSKHFIRIIIIAIILFSCSDINAFDGNRKGFVLGGGVGVTKHGTVTKRTDFTFGWIIGYGLNSKNLIVINRSAYFGTTKNRSIVMSQTNGFGLYHYFKKQKKSFYTKIGVGFNPDGLYLGGGYMFSNNVQLGATYKHFTEKWADNHIQFIISYVAF